MIKIIRISTLLLLCSCAQTTSMFGPAITVASTGNIYQAGLSYGTGKVIEKTTGRTTIENINSFIQPKKKDKEIVKKMKERINNSAQIKNLLDQ